MKILLAFIFVLLLDLNAQTVHSSYLKNPDLAIGYVDSCATFWLSAWDQTRGGFYTNVSKTGAPKTSWGTNKDMISQSRDAYGLTRAYMLTGKNEYLTLADEALKFMYKSAWDSINSGWMNSVNQYGVASNPQEDKTAFLQHYALLGIAAYYEATNDSLHYNWLMKGRNSNEDNLWDDDINNTGYYDFAKYNWSGKTGKSFNATVDALTTNLLYFYLMNEDENNLKKINAVTENILQKIIPTMDSQVIGFAEKYYSNWGINQSETMTIMGHVLKTAWCLARVNQIDPHQEYVDAAEKLIEEVVAKGYDKQFGGPYKDFNRTTGEMLMWGNPDTAKAWWQMEQAVVSGLQMYSITKDEKYLKMADETTDFFMSYFVDHVYGEVYENRTRYGLETWGEHKGNGFKAGYHSIELGYYIYLYSKLLLHEEPATLYYSFAPSSNLLEREILLNPIAMNLNKLIISSVELNGESYSNYDSKERILKIAQNIGGEFKVTFDIDNSVNVVDTKNNLPNKFSLKQNYPNPFNPSTTIEFAIPKAEMVSLKVYNMLGEEVATLINREMDAGFHSINFDASSVSRQISSGLYFYRISAGNFVDVKKMMLLK